jgi:AraC family transcriptional regulator
LFYWVFTESCGYQIEMQALVATTIARHESIVVVDFRCTRRVENIHSDVSLSYVRSGSLRYRARGKSCDLVAGAILIGRPGVDYVCTHEGASGFGECLSFRLGPSLADLMSRAARSSVGSLPPVAKLMVLGELAQAAVNGTTDVGLDEIGFLFASRVSETLSGGAAHVAEGTAIDRRRAIDAAAWIEAHCDEEIDLDNAAQVAGIGPFHFLRTFSKVLGVTPHQYLVRCRLRRAARFLVEDTRSISEIAFEVGFGDLSNFVRTFRRASGLSPQKFRRAARSQSSLLTDALGTRGRLGVHDGKRANVPIESIFSKSSA